ncbi:hypothetical protein LY76DRAFT_417440 [Colletotrichum caudatum]|nr:hypothetical protein LY76DRAFT_417440 [Colletotrichum caudatum]
MIETKRIESCNAILHESEVDPAKISLPVRGLVLRERKRERERERERAMNSSRDQRRVQRPRRPGQVPKPPAYNLFSLSLCHSLPLSPTHLPTDRRTHCNEHLVQTPRELRERCPPPFPSPPLPPPPAGRWKKGTRKKKRKRKKRKTILDASCVSSRIAPQQHPVSPLAIPEPPHDGRY